MATSLVFRYCPGIKWSKKKKKVDMDAPEHTDQNRRSENRGGVHVDEQEGVRVHVHPLEQEVRAQRRGTHGCTRE
jgi:hypothetical protein